MTDVLFDSSFLMAVVDDPTTWYEDIVESVGKFQPVLLGCVRGELEKLAGSQGKRARTARVALELASSFKALPCGGAKVDDEIISVAASTGAFVASVDAVLLKSARGARLKVITLRKGRVALG